MLFRLSSSPLFAASVLALSSSSSSLFVTAQDYSNLVEGCVVNFDPTFDYFPAKYSKPDIASYGDVDIYGNQFVPHNTTDFLDITYHGSYKIVTNKHQDPPVSYLMYQCGTEPPQDVIDNGDFALVLSVPHQGGMAITQTPQIPYIEMLGLRHKIIAYVGDPQYVTSPCLTTMLSEVGADDPAALDYNVEIVYDSNSTIQAELYADFLQRHPDVVVFSGPTNNVVGDRVMVASATQERTNVATFDWISFYASLYNMEGEAAQIAADIQDSYDCSSEVARSIASETKRDLETTKEQPTIFWANYFTYQDLGWSVAECPMWDTAYYCEYATHCDATVLSRPPGVGTNRTFGSSPTVYWYLNDEQVLDMARDADIMIFSGSSWEATYALKNETLDQIKAVQNQQVFDTLGQGPSAWNEQRYAEYDVVGLDMCDVVGHANADHTRRWFRNVYTEPVGSLGECNVPDEITQPLVPPGQECVRPSSLTSGGGDSTMKTITSAAATVLATTMIVTAMA